MQACQDLRWHSPQRVESIWPAAGQQGIAQGSLGAGRLVIYMTLDPDSRAQTMLLTLLEHVEGPCQVWSNHRHHTDTLRHPANAALKDLHRSDFGFTNS